MRKKAIILDLDNTIYSVHSIGHALFQSLFELIKKDANHVTNMNKIKDDLMRRPFQLVARDYLFSEALIEKATYLLQHLSYDGPIEIFSDYNFIKHLHIDRFLVTTGFQKLQQSKIDGLNIADDFNEIHIVDPTTSTKTKKDVFADIIKRHTYDPAEVLVVGDDLQSEIKAAMELQIEAVLYDRENKSHGISGINSIHSFEEIADFL